MAKMEPDRDVFASFIEVLAATLDETPAPMGELAARAFLSRSHFDRLVTGIAREPPGRFRRRILLERAAHRLRFSDAVVIDVALEAGYSSNEAFTRAFRRAFGAAPSAWRLTPGSFVLPSANRVHYHPPGGLRLPANKEVTPVELIIRMLEHHLWVIQECIDRARTVPVAALDQEIAISVETTDDSPTIRSLLSRLVGQMAMWNESISNGEYDFEIEKNEPLDSIESRLLEEGAKFLANARQFCDAGMLDETFVDALCDPPRVFTYGGMIAHVLTHAAHRRMLVVGALATAGATEVAYDPMAWVALRP
ncbi:MAG: helix-turn-helix domain-containing protein [Dehalococcoidia bacterium]